MPILVQVFLSTYTGCPESPGAFQDFGNKCDWFIYIQKQDKTKTGGNKPRPFANCLLDVTAVGGDDGLDAVAEALAGLDDVGRLQSLARCHDASLQRLKVGVRGGLDLIL